MTSDDDDRLPDAEERRAAEELARVLDGEAGEADADALAAVRSIRAAAGREAPLGELRARGLAKAAVAAATAAAGRAAPARSRWSALLGLAAVAAVVLLVVTLWRTRGDEELPERLCSRSAGMLVPGPFPATQTAAQRLDLVTNDRLVALRDVRARRSGGRR